MFGFLHLAVLLCAISGSTTLASSGFTLDEFIAGSFTDKKWQGVWYDETHILDRKDDNFVLHDVTTDKATDFLTAKQLVNFPRATLTISPSKQFVLVKHSATKVYRHSTLAKYAVLDRDNMYKEVQLPAEIRDEQIRICRFTADESLIAVRDDNNIYLITNLGGAPTLHVITRDNSANTFNGVPDWIYEEEVFSGDSALWPSPFSPAFAFAKFDDAEVPEFTYFKYGEPGNYKNVYPEPMTVRYPKSGAPNPTFSVHVYNGTQQVKLGLVLDASQETKDYVLYDMAWRSQNVLVVLYTNREQSKAFLDECDVVGLTCKRLDSREEAHGWLVIKPLQILEDGRVLQVVHYQNFDGFHIIEGDSNKKLVSLGEFTVEKIIGHNGSRMYFTGAEASTHSQQQVYFIDIDLPDQRRVCLSCEQKASDERCLQSSAVFNKEMSYVTRICSGPGPTYVDIHNLKENKIPMVYIDNNELRANLSSKLKPLTMDLSVGIPGTNMRAAVRLLLPPSFDDSKKYAMLVNVYAGPNSNQITDAYSIGVQHYLTTYKEYIYAFIDARGSGKRGYKLMHQVYKGLGTHEIDDQISITKALIKDHAFIDKNHVGIWGWSYGGFATAHVIARNKDTFKCGISVAPVTDFIYYDSIYTERYMGVYNDSDQDVKAIYGQTDVTKLAESFRDKHYMLVHGNADDNVHYQQGMLFARALELADVPFQQMSYPEEAHHLDGVKPHLYHMLDAFWSKYLGVGSRAGTRGRYLVDLV